MHILSSTIKAYCHLSSVVCVFHILYLFSRLDNIIYSPLVSELSVICVSSIHISLYSKIALGSLYCEDVGLINLPVNSYTLNFVGSL
jgi:hypothetical protein